MLVVTLTFTSTNAVQGLLHDRKPILADISNAIVWLKADISDAMVGFKDLGGGAIRAIYNLDEPCFSKSVL